MFLSHATKVILKIPQARLHYYVNGEPPGVQAGFQRGIRTRDQIANVEKAKKFQKTSIYFFFINYANTFDSGSQQTVENSAGYGSTRSSYMSPEKSVFRQRSNS